jgi:hypothetical protein
MGKWTKQSSKEETQILPQKCKDIVNIPNHKGNANQIIQFKILPRYC